MLASAVSTIALEKARPTRRSSGSFTEMRNSAVAASFDLGSSCSRRTTRVVHEAKSPGSLGQARQKAARAASALASTSSPVRATTRSLR